MGLESYWDLILALSGFWLIFALSLRVKSLRASLSARSTKDWFVDLIGLLIQGWMVPLAKIGLLLVCYQVWIPAYQGVINLPSWFSFLLAFVGVDYFYYWNHRLLHTKWFWPLHRLHHSTEHLDVLSSARNSIWTPLFLVYIWAHSLMAFLLVDPTPYVLGATLTSILDLWRHCRGLEFPQPIAKIFARFLVTSRDHAWHHNMRSMKKNYGANLKMWDQLHGTFEQHESVPTTTGWSDHSSIFRQLFFPW